MYSKVPNKVERLLKKVINKDFKHLKNIPFIVVFRKKSKPGEDGMIIAGQIRVLSAKMLAVYGVQVELELSLPVWKALSKQGKYELLWHELNHLVVDTDEETGEPARDKSGNIIVYTQDHDLVLRTFRDEIRKFGLKKHDVDALKFLHETYVAFKKGKIKTRKVHKLGDDEIDWG